MPGTRLAVPFRRWLTLFAGCVTAVVVSMLVIDRPVASYMSRHTRPLGLLRWTVELHRWADEASLIVIVSCALLATAAPRYRPRSHGLTATLFLTACTVIVTRAVKDQLQLAFGRTWPETWVDDNPSFIRDQWFSGSTSSMAARPFRPSRPAPRRRSPRCSRCCGSGIPADGSGTRR